MCGRLPRSWRRCAGRVEFNIEGDPRPDLLPLVLEVRPDQCTLVPVLPGEITSQAGWPPDTPREVLAGAIRDLHAAGVRVSLFVDPLPAPIRWARELNAERVELYTEPFARAFEKGPGGRGGQLRAVRRRRAARARLGLGVNAGHDLDLRNLTLFRTLPHLDEVSIGHALISHALFVGLRRAVRDYLAALCAGVGVTRLGEPARLAHVGVCLIVAAWVALDDRAERGGSRRDVHDRRTASTIAGTLYESSNRPAPAVVLVHMLGESKDEWIDARRAPAGRRRHGAGHRSARTRRLVRQRQRRCRRWWRTCERPSNG